MMNNKLNEIVNEIKLEGKDYSDFKTLLSKLKGANVEIDRDDVLNLLSNDSRIQLHTTSNSIAKLIAYLVNRTNSTSTIDICCGTGNILYYLQNSILDLTGVEIDENVALITSYFSPDLRIITADTFKYPFSRKYDSVIGNIPWGMKVEYNGNRINCEEGFIRKSMDLCAKNGEVILLVPNTVLISSQFRQLRKDLNSFVKEIIAIPTWNIRNVHVRTAVIVLNKQESTSILFSELSQFDDLTDEYIKVNKREISRNLIDIWDPRSLNLKESDFYKELEGLKTVQLQELAEIINGRHIASEQLNDHNNLLYLKPVHIKNGHLMVEKSSMYVNASALNEKELNCILQPGDIVISTIFNDLKMYLYSSDDVPAFASNNLAIIRSSEQDYILSYLQTEEGRRVFQTQAEDLRKGATIPHISLKDLQGIRIPVLPIAELNKFGNKSIETSTKSELQSSLELLESFKTESLGIVQESVGIYGTGLDYQANLIIHFLNDRFKRVEAQLSTVEQKLDKLLDAIKDLQADFGAIRRLPRDDEEKLFKLCQKIDSKLERIYFEEKTTIDGYVEEVKRWLDLWELLDDKSKKFLPIAEFIFDELNKISDADYAPFIIQYCRTLENEILKKLFESYHLDGLQDVDRITLVRDELEHPNTSLFANMVLKNKMQYDLGKMARIMSYLKEGGKTLSSSKLLQHFRAFTIAYFDIRIVEAGFLKDIDKLTNEYRNKAAHPYSIDLEMAKGCQELLRKSLNEFLECIRSRSA